MSGYKGHFWAGTLSFVVLGIVVTMAMPVVKIPYLTEMFQSWWKVLVLLATVLLAALWPDVDTDSKGRRIFYWVFLLAAISLILLRHYIEAAVLGMFAMLPNVGRHRGWTHTIWAAVGLSSVLFWLPMYFARAYTLVGLPYAIAFFVGYLSHLILDKRRH